MDEFGWLDARPKHTGLENRAEIMRDGGQEGKDRIWWCDGEYIWFRRAKSNPETLKRHDIFVKAGDYKYVETSGDIEIYQVKPQSQFATGKQLDITMMNNYNLRRQAALAACRRDWQAFHDVMSFLRERINAQNRAPTGGVTPLADDIYAEHYMGVITSIIQRNGPSAGEINQEIIALTQKDPVQNRRMISIAGAA